MTGWRLRGAWAWIAAAAWRSSPSATPLYVYTNAVGSYGTGWFFDAGWPIAAVMIASRRGCRCPPSALAERRAGARWAWPLVLAAICLALLVYDHFARAQRPRAGTRGDGARRGARQACDHVRPRTCACSSASRREALTDGLTGLGNRRALMADLERRLDAATREPAGARALRPRRLQAVQRHLRPPGRRRAPRPARRGAGSGGRRSRRAYRLGGDEFCIVCAARRRTSPPIARRRGRADRAGRGLRVGCSFGAVLAARRGDRRRRGAAPRRPADVRSKKGGRPRPGARARTCCCRSCCERDPELGAHLHGVAELAEAVGQRSGSARRARATCAIAAELHDVGKVAIPEAILAQAGPARR